MSAEGSEALKITIPDDLCPQYQREDIDAETDKLLKEQLAIEEKLLKISVKVYEPMDRDNHKMITLEKTNTVRELFKLIKENTSDDFIGRSLDNVDEENIRLRQYDPKLKVKLAVYEDRFDNEGKNVFD